MSSSHSAEMLHLLTGFQVSRALYVAAKLGVADLLETGSKTCDELGHATSTDRAALYRVLRVLAASGVFTLDGERVSTNPLAQTLQTGVPGSLRGWAVDQLGGEHYQAWGDLLHSVQTGETAFDHVFGTNAWEHRAQHPESAQAFDEGMASFIGVHDRDVLAAYPFAALESLYDIGGGDGRFISAALTAFPKLRGLLLDMPQVVQRARVRLADAGLAARCEVVEGNIFQAVPTGGAAYLMSRVIHDWNDAQAREILGNCRRAMAATSRLLLVERILPDQIDASPVTRALAVSDLNMLVMTGGQERTRAAYAALLETTGFRLTSVSATQTALSVIEAQPM